jgi:GT2 family glycosyltransferase
MTRPRLSSITVTYNSGALIGACLRALWPQLDPSDEVFVVDNASSDGSLDGLAGAFPGVRLIQNSTNLGYAGGNNVALRRARGEYILLLNPDVVLDPRALSIALAYLDANPDVGVLGARILLPTGRLDPPARRTFKTPATYLYKLMGLSRLFPRHRRFGHYYLSYLDDDCIADVDAVVGAFLLTRRSVVEQVGLLDERFFMYCEDEDWCWRAKQAGWRIVYHPDVVAHHRKGSSARMRRFAMICHWHRSIFLYHRKNIAPRYPAMVNVPIYGGMLASLMLTLGITGVRQLLRRDGPRLPASPATPVPAAPDRLASGSRVE